MSDNAFANGFPADDGNAPSYNRNLLNAVGLALSFAILAISAALAWDQMSLVIDNVQRRDYVEQLDTLKNNQRKLVYSLDQTARLHSRLLVEQHRSEVCETDIVFPGELNIPPAARRGNPHTELHVTTTLGDTGCASRFGLLRRLSRSLAVSIRNFWRHDSISNYTFDSKGRFLAQGHRFADMPSANEGTAQQQIAIATAPLRTVLRHLQKTDGLPALPFFTGLHLRNADKEKVLSIGVPIYSKEKLLAITALDIEQRGFNSVFMPDGRLPGFFVFDTSGASPGSPPALLNNIAGSESPLAQSIVKHWNAINMVAHDMTPTKIGHRFYLAETIPGTPWVAIYSFSFGDIFLASESLWMWIGFSMFGALLLLWIGIHLINRHMLVAEATLLRARHSAEEANAAKSMFLATISHEIRTPLHGAMGNLELLENTPLSLSQRSTIDTINRAFFSLLQIINNVLDLSKAGADQLHLSNDAFDPVRLLEEVARTFAPCIAKKQVEFFCLLDTRLPKRLIGDETRLRQIFNNLLSNAAKFTVSGKIVLRADFKEISAGACSFAVQVIDSGIGISQHDQKKLFTPFQQANRSIAGNFGGTGLGLSLIKNLCEAMGATIEVDSREDRGASFTVGLRLPVADTEAAANLAAVALPRPLDGLAIALCCGDRAWRKQLRRQLESAGASVVPAAAENATPNDAAPPRIACDTFLLACQDNQTVRHLPLLADYPDARHVIVTPLGPFPPELQDGCVRVSALSQCELISAVDPRFVAARARSHADVEEAIPRMEISAVSARGPSPDPSTPAGAAAPNILLVDDDLTNVALAQRQLAMLGYGNIDLAKNGLDALDKCEEKTYQLILTDQFMPGMDGNQLAAALREKSYPGKIIMITASRPKSEDHRNLDAVLIKPASLDQLRKVLDSHCQPLAAMAPPAMPSSQAILWNAFLQDYKSTIDTLEAAACEGDRDKCLRQLHKLKGALEILRQPLAKDVAILEHRSKTAPFNALTEAYRALHQTLDDLICKHHRH